MGQEVIMLTGLPGSGKTTLAKRIAQMSSSYLVIGTDQTRQQLGFAERDYQHGRTKDVYLAMIKSAIACVERQCVPVLDATFFRREYRTILLRLCERYDFGVVAMCLVTDPEVCRQRIMGRSKEKGLFKGVNNVEVFDRIVSQYETITLDESSRYMGWMEIVAECGRFEIVRKAGVTVPNFNMLEVRDN